MGCIITIGHLKYYIGFASSPHQQSKFDAHISQLNLLNSHKHIKDAEMKTNQNLKLVGLKQHNNMKRLQTTNKWEDCNCKSGELKDGNLRKTKKQLHWADDGGGHLADGGGVHRR